MQHQCLFGSRACQEFEVPPHHVALAKLSFPKFYGDNPRIWIDKCSDYFIIFNIPDCMWTTTTSLHMEDNAVTLLQLYKIRVGLEDWPTFVAVVENKFGAYDYKNAMQDLLGLK
jgi:hypothetical protein